MEDSDRALLAAGGREGQSWAASDPGVRGGEGIQRIMGCVCVRIKNF